MRSADPVTRGPMGGGEVIPTSAAHRRTVRRYARGRGGEFPNSNVGERSISNLWNGLARPIGTSDRADAPSTTKSAIHTIATLARPEKVSRNPLEDLKMTPLGLIYAVYGWGGGQQDCRLAGEPTPRHPRRVTRYGNWVFY